MAIIEHQLVIHAPRETVWAISRDYAIRNQWDDFSHRTELLMPEQAIAIGSRVHIQAKNGLGMTVEYVQFSPPHVAAIVMRSHSLLLAHFAGSWRFIEQANNHTLAKFRYVARTQAWTIPVVSEKLAAVYFGRVIKRRLAGLKRYCEAVTENHECH
jgi:hypothetical protein